MENRKIFIIGENHTTPILTFTKIQKIKLKNPDLKFLYFGEFGMEDSYKRFDKNIDVMVASQIISDISMIIYAYIGLVTWEEDKNGYSIVMQALVKKNIFSQQEYISPYSTQYWINEAKVKLIQKISELLKQQHIPDKIIKNIITYLEGDNWQEALNIMQKIVDFSIFRKTLEYQDLPKNYSFIIIVGQNHIKHMQTIFKNSELLGGNIARKKNELMPHDNKYFNKYMKYKIKYLKLSKIKKIY